MANIADCLQATFNSNNKANSKLSDSTSLDAINTQSDKIKEIIFKLSKPAYVKLYLKDQNEKIIATIIDYYFENIGTQTKLLPINKLAKGTYWVELNVDGKVLREQVLVE